jgi:hypothetical protein
MRSATASTVRSRFWVCISLTSSRRRGFGLSLVGYVANAAQTPGPLLGIKALQTLYPCIAFLIAAAVLLFLYSLTDARQAQIVSKLRTSDQVAEISDDDIEGEVDPRVMHAGTAASPVGSRPGGNHPAGG